MGVSQLREILGNAGTDEILKEILSGAHTTVGVALGIAARKSGLAFAQFELVSEKQQGSPSAFLLLFPY